MIFKPRLPKNKIRQFLYMIVMSEGFDVAITTVVLLNTIVMALRYARMSDSYAFGLEILNYIFTFLYNVEFVMKFGGIGMRYFTGCDFNLFDFI